MGCFTSSERAEAVDWDNIPWTLENLEVLDAAIDFHLAKFTATERRRFRWPVYAPLLRTITTLLRKRSSLTGRTDSLDQCNLILSVFTTGDGSGMPAVIYLWALLTHGEVLYERFEISHEPEDLDTAITALLRHAEKSQSTDLNTTIPVARAMTALVKSRKPPEMAGYVYILDNVWPRVANTKIGSAVMRYITFLWRLEYMQTGAFEALQSCIEATRAADIVFRALGDECTETNAQDLAKLTMMMYFHPNKGIDTSELAMPEWTKSGAQSEKTDKPQLAISQNTSSAIAAIYQPLRNREMRLVEIQPGDSGSSIHCRVFVTSLDSNSVFEVRHFYIMFCFFCFHC
jgi:hypothetical protein